MLNEDYYSFYRTKELRLIITTLEIEIKNKLKNGESKEGFTELKKRKCEYELELAQLNMKPFEMSTESKVKEAMGLIVNDGYLTDSITLVSVLAGLNVDFDSSEKKADLAYFASIFNKLLNENGSKKKIKQKNILKLQSALRLLLD
ncbi:hypothetical protein CO725_24115 [Vibrio parahaemolyticus]|uniref:hypothetical protein n=1 Tax=Vibrio parahaemolyticus TaxID=670 RepID=UPI000BE38CC9|nr:hypothetical protein [Vibrio parahaemolyticus]ATI48509.1 hypothetical protein CO725_24115 [Vibrio parahaemolyticus]